MSEPTTIAGIDATVDHLQVRFNAGTRPLVLPWFWVKDHSQDDASFDANTSQRTVNTFSLRTDARGEPPSATLADQEVRVVWGDGTPPSVLPASLLIELSPDLGADGKPSTPGYGPVQLWRNAADIRPEPTPFTELRRPDGAGLRAVLGDMERYGFALVSDVAQSAEGPQLLADTMGYVRRTIFGDVWPLSSDITDHADSAYGESALEPHTDGSYSHDGPGVQLFVCAERTGTGGESVLVDGFAIAEELRTEEPEAFELLSTVSVPAHYREPGIDLRASRPTIRTAPGTHNDTHGGAGMAGTAGRVVQVTFNNYDRSPFLLAPDLMRRWYRAYAAFHELIVDHASWWIGRLEPGDALIFDNWRCLHGRQAYTGRRSFFGCYLNHEDLESKIRTCAKVTAPH